MGEGCEAWQGNDFALNQGTSFECPRQQGIQQSGCDFVRSTPAGTLSTVQPLTREVRRLESQQVGLLNSCRTLESRIEKRSEVRARIPFSSWLMVSTHIVPPCASCINSISQ